MIETDNMLPLKTMTGIDWDKIFSGFVITSSTDSHIPRANVFSEQILTYLFNLQLNVTDYTHYHAFHFSTTIHVEKPFWTYSPEGIYLLDQGYANLVCDLQIYMPNTQCFAQVDKHEALRMIAQLLLDSVPKYLFDRDDFDGKKFYEDILPIVQPIANGTRTFREEEFPL